MCRCAFKVQDPRVSTSLTGPRMPLRPMSSFSGPMVMRCWASEAADSQALRGPEAALCRHRETGNFKEDGAAWGCFDSACQLFPHRRHLAA